MAAVGVCVRLARRRTSTAAAALLGAGAGIAFAGAAALIKTATNLLAQGVVALVFGWQLYALIVVGATGMLLSQLAYRSGPVSASLPAMNSVNPLASVLIGVAVFDEHFQTGAHPLHRRGLRPGRHDPGHGPCSAEGRKPQAPTSLRPGRSVTTMNPSGPEPYPTQHQPRRKHSLRIIGRPLTPAQPVPPCWR